jgi:hypothetical protein
MPSLLPTSSTVTIIFGEACKENTSEKTTMPKSAMSPELNILNLTLSSDIYSFPIRNPRFYPTAPTLEVPNISILMERVLIAKPSWAMNSILKTGVR